MHYGGTHELTVSSLRDQIRLCRTNKHLWTYHMDHFLGAPNHFWSLLLQTHGEVPHIHLTWHLDLLYGCSVDLTSPSLPCLWFTLGTTDTLVWGSSGGLRYIYYCGMWILLRWLTVSTHLFTFTHYLFDACFLDGEPDFGLWSEY